LIRATAVGRSNNNKRLEIGIESVGGRKWKEHNDKTTINQAKKRILREGKGI